MPMVFVHGAVRVGHVVDINRLLPLAKNVVPEHPVNVVEPVQVERLPLPVHVTPDLSQVTGTDEVVVPGIKALCQVLVEVAELSHKAVCRFPWAANCIQQDVELGSFLLCEQPQYLESLRSARGTQFSRVAPQPLCVPQAKAQTCGYFRKKLRVVDVEQVLDRARLHARRSFPL